MALFTAVLVSVVDCSLLLPFAHTIPTELKELIAMHSSLSPHGGDLKNDTVNIIGATLDLQEKVVMQAMTPIRDVFMLHIDSKLDYELLKKICQTGHSRVPVYEEVDVPAPISPAKAPGGRMKVGKDAGKGIPKAEKAKKIVGILLVKQCVLLDPKGAFNESTRSVF